MQNKIKPSKITVRKHLHDFYWLKVELIHFCKQHKLSTNGAKSDLIKRIDAFVLTGRRISLPTKKSSDKDSFRKITKQTPVLNYNNDAETRKFFISQIGDHFKFNSYLRQFTNKNNIKPNLTYGDLVVGWVSFESRRKNNRSDNKIPQQFEYNQFIKDYFYNEKKGTLRKAIAAWKVIKSLNGPNTYAQFKRRD